MLVDKKDAAQPSTPLMFLQWLNALWKESLARWLFLIGIASDAVTFFLPALRVPVLRFIAYSLLVIGFVWANFRVYRKQLTAIDALRAHVASSGARRAKLVIHPRGPSTYIAARDRPEISVPTKIYAEFNLAIENRGSRTSNVDKFEISIPKANKDFAALQPAYPTNVYGRRSTYGLPGTGLARGGHITIEPEKMSDSGNLAFFVPFGPADSSNWNSQQLDPIDCILTISDTEGTTASHQFLLEEH